MSDQDCTPLDLPAVKERREAALRQVFGLCGGPATFTISIPSQETDSDVLLRAALEDSVRLEAELTAARNEAAELRAENERLRRVLDEWQSWAGKWQSDLYWDDSKGYYDELMDLMCRLAGNEEGEQ